jgi:hypothetical protein
LVQVLLFAFSIIFKALKPKGLYIDVSLLSDK